MDRKIILLPVAIVIGLAGGYAWSAITAPPPHLPKPPKAAFADIPESPGELPTVEDREWRERAGENAVDPVNAMALPANRAATDNSPSH